VSFRGWARALSLLPLLVATAPVPIVDAADDPSPVRQQPAANGSFMSAMKEASRARAVPLALVEATAYVNTQWEWINSPAVDRGVGPMHVTPSQMPQASRLSGHTLAEIKGDLAANLDSGAALLAHHHSAGADLASWRGAVVATQGPFVADQVYSTLQSGATRTTSTGETITLQPQPVSAAAAAPHVAGGMASPDYPPAAWIPAAASNYTVADRAHDYPIDMIVIHDIEGSYGSAIQAFQNPDRHASAHYVVGYQGQVAQMVLEKDIAWHAGNWDYNTRAIGIEHEGFAWTPGLYTAAEYNASAQIAATICSHWGVPLDRNHVIGHDQVPDPNNPNLTGGSDHHTDPGPYWNWTSYMQQAQADSRNLPSPPHMMPDPIATNGATSATVTWKPARTCRAADRPITGYTVVIQPGGMTMNLPATATTATFTGLTYGTTYSFAVTATNADGQDTATSNPIMVGACTGASVTTSPASPQLSGTGVTVTAAAATCPNPRYQFWIQPPAGDGSYQLAQAYSSSSTFNWGTTGLAKGTYRFSVWVRDSQSTGTFGNRSGRWDAYNNSATYTLTSQPCASVSVSASPATQAGVGTTVSLTAQAAGCLRPSYQFALKSGSGAYQVVQAYSTSGLYRWDTSDLPPGAYRFSVWARDASSTGIAGNTTGRWDAYNNNLAYSLYIAKCSSVAVSAAPQSRAGVGASVTVSGASAGCPKPLYHFALLAPGGNAYQLLQDYSTSPTFTWSTAGLVPGTYRFSVWARDASSAGAYGNSAGRWDTYNNTLTYTLTSCSAVSVSASPPSPATRGMTVTLTASAAGCPNANPLYEFWVLAPGAAWALGQAYSTNATLIWNTTGLAAGSYRFSVRARDASSGGATGNASGRWDAYNNSVVYVLR